MHSFKFREVAALFTSYMTNGVNLEIDDGDEVQRRFDIDSNASNVSELVQNNILYYLPRQLL